MSLISTAPRFVDVGPLPVLRVVTAIAGVAGGASIVAAVARFGWIGLAVALYTVPVLVLAVVLLAGRLVTALFGEPPPPLNLRRQRGDAVTPAEETQQELAFGDLTPSQVQTQPVSAP